jgi:hypothetical protein
MDILVRKLYCRLGKKIGGRAITRKRLNTIILPPLAMLPATIARRSKRGVEH